MQKSVLKHNEIWKPISVDTILANVSEFKVQYKNLLSEKKWNDEMLDFYIAELDMILTSFNLLYNNVTKNTLNGNINNLAIIYILRFIFHDILTIRNLWIARFEFQINYIFRTLLEKIDIVTLLLFDKNFWDYYIKNITKLSNKELYHKFLKPSKIKERIQKNYQSILDDEAKTWIMFARIDKDYYRLRLNWRIEEIYSKTSKFIHSNNFQDFINYYAEFHESNLTFNISLLHNSSNNLYNTLSFITEYLLIIFPYLRKSIYSWKDYDIFNLLDYWYIASTFEEKYK